MRTSTGCWTCRLRRKKCDERRPRCENCEVLEITCHFSQNSKPGWMDGGELQNKMSEQIKNEIKEKALRRRQDRGGEAETRNSEQFSTEQFQQIGACGTTYESPRPVHDESLDQHTFLNETTSRTPKSGTGCTLAMKDAHDESAFGRSETALLAFYIEYLLPFLFPFYRPRLQEGGRAWMFELMLSSPVVRQATLCQSAYFFNLARGTSDNKATWTEVYTQTTNALTVLRYALQVIQDSTLADHLHGAVRVMASVMQVQRFEISILSFANWQTHLNASLALFQQILQSETTLSDPAASFRSVGARLSSCSSAPLEKAECQSKGPTAEQAAFQFSSTVLIFDDIIASVSLGETPKLYDYHRHLLGSTHNHNKPIIDVSAVIGLDNSTLLRLGEIAALAAWKQSSSKAGTLDVMELVRRASSIKETLVSHLMRSGTDETNMDSPIFSVLDLSTPTQCQRSMVARIWSHAALLYLSIVVSGWQPSSSDVCFHVNQVIELMKLQELPMMIRTVVWPFCVAGCLADRSQEAECRNVVSRMQPLGLFGTVHKALEVMENVWNSRDKDNRARDLATCFSMQGEVVLLV